MLEMFDNVRVRTAPLTEQLGLAGLVGQIYGETTPSLTAVEVIGDHRDHAFNVVITGKPKSGLWFSPDLLEFVDHAPGSTMRLGNQSFTRLPSGEWRKT